MPAGRSTGRSSRGPRARRRAERRLRLRRTILGSAVAVAGLSAVAVYTASPWEGATTSADGRAALSPTTPSGGSPSVKASSEPGRGAEAEHSPGAGAAHSAPPGHPSPGAPESPKHSAGPSVPASGPGIFTASTVSGRVQGKGPALRWRVEAEQGSGIDPNTAARTVEAVLGDPRGWIRNPAYGFQLAGAGQLVDFTVKIATPTTTDRLCDVVTPSLKGETNCRAGHTVVVNLKRWMEGSPQFSGSVEEYRALIVNHEVGHEIGRGHETCPGPGKPAPAMMQQIKGLLGCRSNAWPYDANGTYLSGPSVP
ncbi:DUF3152 domain-containing protein [Streptomyces sp. NPDC051567]|uniref:DUF3152 domain-containing protein n=1 Tax=Streptomyces sp. NPDC051567 TaxID=3365660 RepID=UPI00379EC186